MLSAKWRPFCLGPNVLNQMARLTNIDSMWWLLCINVYSGDILKLNIKFSWSQIVHIDEYFCEQLLLYQLSELLREFGLYFPSHLAVASCQSIETRC